MLFWNIFVFFLLPLLVLFLTRKLSVRGMILWTAGVQVVALLLRMVVYPVRLSLSWGMSLLESLSYSNLSAWYSGSGVQLIYLAVSGKLFGMFLVSYRPDRAAARVLEGLRRSGTDEEALLRAAQKRYQETKAYMEEKP